MRRTAQWGHRWITWVAIATTAGLAACRPPEGTRREPAGEDDKPVEVREEKPFLTPVVAINVERGEVYSSVATTGTAVPLRSRFLAAEEAGRLRFARDWTEGDFVEAGTLIAEIESDSLETEIETARSDVQLREEGLSIARKSMEAAIRDYETFQDLYTRGIAALKDVDSAKLTMDRAINTHRQDQINLERARLELQNVLDRLEELKIIAPFDGLLVARTTLEGSTPFSTTFGTETITDNDGRMISDGTNICGIIDVSKMIIRCDVTSRDIDSVRLGQRSVATIYASEALEVEGEVVDISRSVNQDTRAFEVDVLVDNGERLLRPGMFGRVDIVTETRRDTISIDKDVLVRRNNRTVVYTVEDGLDTDYKVAREVEVETGIEGRDEIEITFGLQAGDQIIVRGYEFLQDNAPVSVLYADRPTVGAEDAEEDNAEEAGAEERTTQRRGNGGNRPRSASAGNPS